MPTYADELRRLAKMLDDDFYGNVADVVEELKRILFSLLRERIRIKKKDAQ